MNHPADEGKQTVTRIDGSTQEITDANYGRAKTTI